jgi:hypothetical protein
MIYCLLLLFILFNIVYCQVNKQFSSINDFPLDKDNHVLDHWLIYLNNPYCKNLVENTWRQTTHDLRLLAGNYLSLSNMFIDHTNISITIYHS